MIAEMTTNLTIEWQGGTKAEAALKAEYLDTKVAVPTSLGGSGNGADPNELLVASATTCYLATLTYMLESTSPNLPVLRICMRLCMTRISVPNSFLPL